MQQTDEFGRKIDQLAANNKGVGVIFVQRNIAILYSNF